LDYEFGKKKDRQLAPLLLIFLVVMEAFFNGLTLTEKKRNKRSQKSMNMC